MSLESIQQALLDRWLTAYDEIDQLPYYKAQAVKMMYGDAYLYQLQQYQSRNFQPDRPLSDLPSERLSGVYGLDVSGKPCYTSIQTDWEGFYLYGDTYVEYLEFYIPLGILYRLERLQLDQGKKISYQSFSLNGMGRESPYAGKAKEYILTEELKRKDFISTVALYEYKKGKIKWADCLYNMPGIGKYTSREKYGYNDSGELDEIVSADKEGHSQYTYVKPPADMPLDELSEQVSQLLAADVLAAIVKSAPKEPLMILELNYQDVGNYFPLLQLVSEAYWSKHAVKYGEEGLFDAVVLSGDNPLTEISFTTSERIINAFIGEITKSGDYDAARRMMYKAAWHLTTGRLNKQVAVSDQFIAYAVDWSMCPEDVGEILTACGMPAAQLNDWKKRGIL
ncbi:hypothetical protein [Chitinophaga arvensicola]|uniref:Uncharacterized protein n=1 Tax=Chitinophaga arvensicola TaxID=29529 RepID=A0A1I0RN35_9BACT|nr:hypothetical protein [Chitinophaga arvensicola]SEW42498.1 hypothetical protein SAMN04488122_3109 [Chitinophaga arvensicola]